MSGMDTIPSRKHQSEKASVGHVGSGFRPRRVCGRRGLPDQPVFSARTLSPDRIIRSSILMSIELLLTLLLLWQNPAIVLGATESLAEVPASQPAPVPPPRTETPTPASAEPAKVSSVPAKASSALQQLQQELAEAPKEPSTLQKQLRRELGEAAISEQENPLLGVLQQMREVEILLARRQTGDRTQQIQKQILADLDRLLAEAQKAGVGQAIASAQGKPDSGVPGSPQEAGSPGQPKEISSGPAKSPSAKPPSGPGPEQKPAELQELRSLLQQVWGLLPPSQRQQMLETPVEEFLPKYKPLIIDYFRRLTELRAKEK